MNGADRSPGAWRRADIWIPFACGLSVLAFGYVALILFWSLGVRRVGLPGLFHYPDATWGDGLLLPVLGFCQWFLIKRLDRPPNFWPSLITYGLGAAAGGLLIFTWWADPRPSLNWTLPRPHYFTLAGEWHAAFLIAASGFFAGSWIELFRRLRTSVPNKTSRVLASPMMAGAVACTAGYAWLAASDSSRAVNTASGLGSLVAIAVSTLALIACLTWAADGALAKVVRSVVAGMLLAVALVVFTDTYGRTGPFMLFVALAGALGAGVALAGAPGHGVRLINLETVAVSALYALLVLVAAHIARLIVVIIDPVAAIILSVGLRQLYSIKEHPRRSWLSVSYLAGAGISACLLGAGAFGLWLSTQKANAYVTAGFLLTIIGAVLGGVFLPYYRTDYIRLMQFEGDPAIRQPDGRPSSNQRRTAVEAWLRLGGYAISSTASMLVLTVALAPSLGWRAGAAGVAWKYPLTTLVIGMLLILPTIGALIQSRKQHAAHGPLFVPQSRDRYVVASFLGGAAVSVLGAIFLAEHGALNYLALLQSVLLTAFMALAMIDNGALLHAREVRPRAWFVIASNCLAITFVIYWSLSNAVQSTSAPTSIGISFAALISAILFIGSLVETASAVVYCSGEQPYKTDYPPFDNIAQDWFLMTCMWFLLAWTPQVVLAHIPEGTHERWSAIGTVLAGFLLLFGPAYLWILENNDTHVERQRVVRKVRANGVLAGLAAATSSADRIKTLPRRAHALERSVHNARKNHSQELSEREFTVRLSGHTATQNGISLILAVSTVVGIIGVSSGLAPTAVGAASLVRDQDPDG